MRKVPALLATAMLCSGPAAAANEVSFQLRATVPVMCQVTDMRAIDLAAGRVEVAAACNADGFRLILGGELGELAITSAAGSGAAVTVHGNQLAVRPDRPGSFRFQLDYGKDLSAVQSASAILNIY